jgi:hypothetical protein
MFRVVCDPSGSVELYLTEINHSRSLMFVMCLVGVWKRNLEPVLCMYGMPGWELVLSPAYRTHTPLVQNYAAKH